MKLKSAQVVLFRNVQDSDAVEIQEDITCLVGKNESGKTSFLQALHGLNPAVAKPLDIMDYPAWLSKAHKLDGKKLEDERPIRTVFQLDDDDRGEVVKTFGEAAKGMAAVAVSRAYGGTLAFEFDFDEAVWVRDFVEQHCDGLVDRASMPKTAAALAEALQTATQAAPAEGDQDLRPAATQARSKLVQDSSNTFDPKSRVGKWLEQRLPKFLYVGRYNTLQGIIDIQRIGGAAYEALNLDFARAASRPSPRVTARRRALAAASTPVLRDTSPFPPTSFGCDIVSTASLGVGTSGGHAGTAGDRSA